MRKLSIDENIANLWKRIRKGKDSDCWPWLAGKDDQGYGKTAIGRIIYDEGRAHRIAFTLMKEAVPAGMDVLHSCDNPSCCNPHHLFLGTQADNNADMFRKKRWKPHPAGDAHPRAKITSEVAKAIFTSDREYKIIAAVFGISIGSVDRIKSGKAWGHATRGLVRGGGYKRQQLPTSSIARLAEDETAAGKPSLRDA